MRFVGYIRVSRKGDRSGDNYITIPVQREAIEQWAAATGNEIVKWFVDEDVTGGKMDRPDFDLALEMLRSKGAEGIAVAKLDRFSRSHVGDALKVAERIHDMGAKLAMLDLQIDTTTPVGEMVFTQMLAIARMQRRQIGDNWRTAQTRAIGRGVHIGPTPVGYRRTGDDGKGKLEPHPQEAPVVQRLFQMRAEGSTWAELCRYLTEHVDPRGRRGNATRWSHGAVQKIIRSRVYLGEVRCGTRGENLLAHEPVITLAEWSDAQRARSVAKTARNEWLLSGLVRCCGCRYMMRGQTGQPSHEGGERRRSYNCSGRGATGGPVCEHSAHVIAHALEGWVVEQAFERHVSALAKAMEASGDLPGAEEAVSDARARVEGLYALQAGAKRPELAAAAIAEAELELERCEQARDEVRLAQAPPGGAGVFTLRDLWDDWTIDERRGALSQMMHCVVVRKHGQGRWSDVLLEERAVILWKDDGPAPAGLPRRGRLKAGESIVGGVPLDWDELKARVAAALD